MGAQTDDVGLVTRYAAGDVAAFEEIYARHKGPLYRYFLRQCGDPEVAGELFQETWVRIIRARERLEPETRFDIQLYQLGHQCLADHYRKTNSPLSDGTGEAPPSEVPDPFAEENDPAFTSSRWSLVDWELESDNPAAERAGRLRAALEAMPPEQREAFLLHEEGNLGLAEIEAVTGADPEIVRARLLFAVKKLHAARGEQASSAGDALS